MLEITEIRESLVNGTDFIYEETMRATLEHSLKSVFKYEGDFKKPFFKMEGGSDFINYINCMTISKSNNFDAFKLSYSNINKIKKYIEEPQGTTYFNSFEASLKEPTAPRKQAITSEMVYAMMIRFKIPMEFEKWNLSRLFNLIRICSSEEQKKYKGKEAQKLAAATNKIRRRR